MLLGCLWRPNKWIFVARGEFVHNKSMSLSRACNCRCWLRTTFHSPFHHLCMAVVNCSGLCACFAATSFVFAISLNSWMVHHQGRQLFMEKLGKKLAHYEKLPIIHTGAFERQAFLSLIHPSLLLICPQIRGTYLYKICAAISSDQFPADLARNKCGPMVHCRWLTTTNHILGLYAVTPNPTYQLQTLAKFIMTVYAPAWFLIKTRPYWYDGPNNFFFMVQTSNKLDPKISDIVQKVL